MVFRTQYLAEGYDRGTLMIVMQLCCGLGNQLFQYALGKQLAETKNTELRFDISWWEQQGRYQSGQDWTITLFEYDVTGEIASAEDLRSVLKYPRFSHWMRRTQDMVRSPKPELFKVNLDYVPRFSPRFAASQFNYYREVRGPPSAESSPWAYRRRFFPGIFDIPGDAYLDGYWQTAKYFEGVAETLRTELSVSDPLPGMNAAVAAEIEGDSPSVSIHVRRGDQTTQGPDSDPMGNALPLSYQQQAAEYVGEQLDDPTFYLFSDDPEWAQRGLDISHPIQTVSHNDETTDYLDIELMRRCDHHVIANSTFSWWGAWLNASTDKIVVAPTPWKQYGYPDGVVFDWDLIPDAWTIFDYREGAPAASAP